MRLIFAGTPQLAAVSLERLAAEHEIQLVITRPDAAIGRRQKLSPSRVAEVAERLGLAILKTDSIGAPELKRIQLARAELGVVVAFGALLPRPALATLPWWNLHFSLLPEWRGATPLQHSMMHGTGIGITVFELETGMDTGPIISQRAMQLTPNETAGEALERFAERGIELVLEALTQARVGSAQLGPASYAPKISRAQARINLSESATKNVAKINALNPEPMAWLELEGEPIRLLRATVRDWATASDDQAVLEPGAIWLDDKAVMLACGAGTALRLLEVQPAGKRAMAAADWFRGLNKKVSLG